MQNGDCRDAHVASCPGDIARSTWRPLEPQINADRRRLIKKTGGTTNGKRLYLNLLFLVIHTLQMSCGNLRKSEVSLPVSVPPCSPCGAAFLRVKFAVILTVLFHAA